jgi:large subunit ribosomal protein L3
MKIGLLGKKIGMTRVYDEKGNATAVTVIEAGGNTALQIKTPERDGYSAVQVGFDTQKESRVTEPQLGHFKKAVPSRRSGSRNSVSLKA